MVYNEVERQGKANKSMYTPAYPKALWSILSMGIKPAHNVHQSYFLQICTIFVHFHTKAIYKHLAAQHINLSVIPNVKQWGKVKMLDSHEPRPDMNTKMSEVIEQVVEQQSNR